MTNSNVIPIGCITTLDLPPDQVLEQACGQMRSVVLIGHDQDGELYFASTIADGGTILWLMEQCKKRLLEVAEDVSDGTV